MSPPTWGRGLKLNDTGFACTKLKVAPHVGAWIETVAQVILSTGSTSPPTWGRGLKLLGEVNNFYYEKSPPTWGRGLKLIF